MEPATIQEIYERLLKAFAEIDSLHGRLSDNIKTDTAFAIGEALGHIAKAKALVGRDIDEA